MLAYFRVTQQVGVAVAGAAGAGNGSGTDDATCGYKGGWQDPVPTPVLLTSQIWQQWPRKRVQQSVVGFYGHHLSKPYACFSNFAEAPVAEPFEFELPDGIIPDGVDRELFPTPTVVEFSEKAIMMCKAAAMADSDSYHAIVRSTTPRCAKGKGRQVYPFDEEKWQAVVCHVAREVVWQKFAKTPRLANILLGTGDRIIAEATRNDKIW